MTSAKTTRRAVLAGAASLPIAAMPAMASDNDAKLLALYDEYVRAESLAQAAFARADDLEEAAIEKQPPIPPELYWEPARCLDIGFDRRTINGKPVLLCNPDDIEKVRRKRAVAFTEVDEAGVRRVHYSKRGQRDRLKIIAAHDAHQAEIAAIENELGLPAAQAEADALDDQRGALANEIVRTRAHSIEGLRVKARIVFENCWCGEPWGDGRTLDFLLINSMFDDLLGHGGGAGSQRGDV